MVHSTQIRANEPFGPGRAGPHPLLLCCCAPPPRGGVLLDEAGGVALDERPPGGGVLDGRCAAEVEVDAGPTTRWGLHGAVVPRGDRYPDPHPCLLYTSDAADDL